MSINTQVEEGEKSAAPLLAFENRTSKAAIKIERDIDFVRMNTMYSCAVSTRIYL